MTGSYWLAADPAPTLRTPRREGPVEVAIVGAGITGCAAALRLAEAGLRVRVHEARTVASGASGRSGGFALRGGAMRYDVAREAYGADAGALWRWTEGYLERMAALAGDGFRRSGSLRLAADAAEREAVRAEYEALREDGFSAEWHEATLSGFHGGILHPGDGAFQPVRLVRRLAAAAAAAGAEVHEHSRIDALEQLDAERVLLATDGYGGPLVPAIRPVRNQVLLTEPLPERRFFRPHYARHGHAYWQQLDDGRLLLGGFRDTAPDEEATEIEVTTPAVQGALEQFLRERLGVEAQVEQRWAGIFGVTRDLLPLAGPLRDGVWVAAGYSGHGNVLGLACGELVADAILGRPAPLVSLFDPARSLSERGLAAGPKADANR